MARATKNTKKKNRKKTTKLESHRLPKWLIYLMAGLVLVIGALLIYRSFASARPNLRFQILKNNTCVTNVASNDSVVHVRIYRTQGNETISNITVSVDGTPVATNPTSISGPVTNLMIASPSLSANPARHTFTVTGSKGSVPVYFSPYCEANGDTSSSVTVSNVSGGNPGTGNGGGGNVTPAGVRLTSYLTPAELSAGSASDSILESSGPGASIYGPRRATIWCNQGQCSVGYNYGNAVSTMIKPSWNCTNGSGWAYQPVSGTKAGRWLCTRDYSIETDPVIRPWLRVAACESGGNWAINTGNGFYGGLQFDLQTWQSVGGQGYPHQNSPHEQAYRANILHSQRGTQPWPICGRYYNG